MKLIHFKPLKRRYNMLFKFSELDWLFHDSEDIDVFLGRIIELIYSHMKISGCSIYLWDESSEQLVYMASKKDSENYHNRCPEKNIRRGEGLCGQAAETGVVEYSGRKRLVMAAPIKRGNVLIGVLRLQRPRRPFSRVDEGLITVLTSQLANILENARLFYSEKIRTALEPGQTTLEFDKQILLQGTGASPGFVFGDSYTLDRKRGFNELGKIKYEKVYTSAELDEAIEKTERQLLDLQKNVEKNLSDSASLIFTSHLLMLKDNSFRSEIKSRINTGINPPAALLGVAENYIKVFSESENPFIREKVEDLEDLVHRIMANLIGSSTLPVDIDGRIVIAKKLYPSDILTLASERVSGILLVSGGVTAHIAILAQSLKLPLAIVDFPELIKTGKPLPVAMDGGTGRICVNPDSSIKEEFSELEKNSNLSQSPLPDLVTSRDGTPVRVLSNINLIPDLEEALNLNAFGVGLYRTEFPFLLRSTFPTEEEQYGIYKQIIDLAAGKPVTFRTLDVGGDKLLSYYRDYTEENPFLGLRSIRFSLKNPAIFKQQIRAILRAAGERKIKLMFPMVSTLEEFRTAKDLVDECLRELETEGRTAVRPELGTMIEIPSLLAVLDHLCAEADFLSIGTNDFIQYMLAVDRNNEKLSEYYTPHNPSVLRGLQTIADAAKKHNVELTICGEMAHQKEYIPFLLGIGIRNLSVSTPFLRSTYDAISGTEMSEAKTVATRALKQSSIFEIERTLGIS